MDEILKDDRFAHIATDPRFKRIPKSERKVKIDKRFQSMFSDNKFKIKYTIDKRGRPIKHSSGEDLKKYYELENSDEESSENDQQETGRFVRAPPEYANKTESDEKIVSENIRNKLRDLQVDYARGEGKLMSESSSSDDEEMTDKETSDDDIIEHQWGELDKDAETTDEATYRLAVCNMDWDRIRAVDLMVLFHSFLPPGGLIRSITVYPSEYGLQRMKEEELNGPPELTSQKENDDNSNDEENEEGSSYHMEKLRQYQLNRLKYYYAIIECDNANTANKIYTECDGLEYESSATRLDLRFVPDDTTFDQDPKDVCTQLPDLSRYQPRYFTTTALQQAKVELTWDETNPERAEIAQKLMVGKIDDITDADLQNYLASSSGSENEASDEENKVLDTEEDSNQLQNDNQKINKYKALLQEIDKNEEEKRQRDVQMEVSWGVSLKEKTDEIMKKKKDNKETLTPFEKYLEKKKEKRKLKKAERKKLKMNNNENDDLLSDDVPSDIDMNDPYFAEEFKNDEFQQKKSSNKKNNNKVEATDENTKNNNAELELLLMDENKDNKHHFSLKKIKDQESESKNKRKKKYKYKKAISNDKEAVEDDFQLNVNDERFSALFHSHHYNIDPADPHYRKTKAMETLIQEKIKRRNEEVNHNDEPKAKSTKNNTELNVLVKAVKRKSSKAFNKKN